MTTMMTKVAPYNSSRVGHVTFPSSCFTSEKKFEVREKKLDFSSLMTDRRPCRELYSVICKLTIFTGYDTV